MFDYIIFFGMVLIAILCLLLHLRRPIQNTSPVDPHYSKCESPIERKLYNALKFNGFYPETQTPCGKYRIDITLPVHRIAIECDGKEFHSSPEQKAHDKRKNTYLKRNGWKVLRFSGTAINRNLGKVLRRINEAIE